MVEAQIHFRVDYTSILYIYKMIKHLLIGLMVVALMVVVLVA